ncbi:MAG: hypothetical protein E6H54_21290, partial [Betaproteobacteria bacterium]
MSNMNDAMGLRMRYGNTNTNGQFDTEYDPTSATVWGFMNPKGNPCFSLALLKEIREHDAALEANGGVITVEGESYPVRYYVGASRAPGAYNLGGDLGLFMLLIKAHDRTALGRYAEKCIDNLYAR